MASRSLLVRILGDDKSVRAAFERSSASAQTFGKSVTGAASKVDTAFTKTQRLAAGGFIGGIAASAGITAIRSLVDAASNSQQVLGQTRVALEATGKSWAVYGKQIENTVQAQSRLGFDDEALLRTFSLFERNTGDVTKALRLNSIAMDVARGRFIDLEQAAQLVNKAALGQAGALRRLGIDAQNGATGLQLLALLQEKYGGAAKQASGEAQGSFDRASVSAENLRESLGTVLLPAVSLLADEMDTAAIFAQNLSDALQKIGGVRIPEIKIPFAFTIGGNSVGGTIGDVADVLKFTPLNPLFGPTIANAIINQFRGQTSDNASQTADLARSFRDAVDTLTSNALDQAARLPGKAKATKGFGTGLTPADLFGPLITDIPKQMQEALLRIQVAGGGPERIRAALQRQQDTLLQALDDPRLTRDQRIDLLRKLRGVQDQIESQSSAITETVQKSAADRQAKIEAANRAAEDATRRQREGFDRLFANLELRLDSAEASGSFRRQRAAVDALQRAVQSQIRVEGRTPELLRQLFDLRSREQSIIGEQRQARQFRLLGLTEAGDKPLPDVPNLRKQLAQLTDRLVDEGEMTSKIRGQLQRIGKVLSGAFGKVTDETRAKVRDMFAGIRAELNKGADGLSKGPLTKTSTLNASAIVEGLGLGRDAEKELRSRLSKFNSAGVSLAGTRTPTGMFAGAQPVMVESHTTITLDGDVVGRAVTRSQQKAVRRNPPQRRGPNAR